MSSNYWNLWTVTAAVSETVAATVSETVAATISETVAATVTETVWSHLKSNHINWNQI